MVARSNEPLQSEAAYIDARPKTRSTKLLATHGRTIHSGHVWTAPWQELFDGCRYGRVRSRVRPFGAALMTAGPNAFRRSGPNRKRALDGALTREGLSDPWIRHVCITSFSPSQFRSWALG